jgi:peroxiredoxin
MKAFLIILTVPVLFLSCKSSKDEQKMEISGTISNNPAKMIYLEEIPMTTMQRVLVDSSAIDKNGKYKLSTSTGEARVYNLRLEKADIPFAAVINDSKRITVDAKFNEKNTQFAETYDVKGSQASQSMKDYMVAFNGKLQAIFQLAQRADTAQRMGGKDSLLQQLSTEAMKEGQEARQITEDALAKSNNPALSMFILGYYQSTASNPGYRLMPFDKSEVVAIVDKVMNKFPEHKGVAAVRSTMQGWVGKQAPEFALPDPNGKMISINSFRGKYLLIDFWASWCKPCRNENPNVVKVFNKYKDKNFTILGVSLDRPGEKDAWMKAVMQDGLAWTQVSDLKYWDSQVVNLYKFGEEGIPYNVLVDPNGKIIAEGLRGEELDAKLAEVLK